MASANRARRNSSSSSRVSGVSGRERSTAWAMRGAQGSDGGRPLGDGGQELPGGGVVGPLGRQVEQLPEERTDDVVGGGRVVPLAHHSQLGPVGGQLPEPLEEPGLAHAGLPDDLDERALAAGGPLHQRGQGLDLVVPTDEGQVAGDAHLLGPGDGAHADRP